MKEYNKKEYNREYNKETYKTVKVYIREEEYPQVLEHMKRKGHTKLSGYIKELINKDMSESKASQTINAPDNKGIIVGRDNNGTINM